MNVQHFPGLLKLPGGQPVEVSPRRNSVLLLVRAAPAEYYAGIIIRLTIPG